MPPLVLRSRVVHTADFMRFALPHTLQFDVRSHAVDAHVVGMEEVVADVELAEPFGHGEAGEVCGLFRSTVEYEVEVGPLITIAISMVFEAAGSVRNLLIAGDGVQVDFCPADLEGRRQCGVCSDSRRHVVVYRAFVVRFVVALGVSGSPPLVACPYSAGVSRRSSMPAAPKSAASGNAKIGWPERLCEDLFELCATSP